MGLLFSSVAARFLLYALVGLAWVELSTCLMMKGSVTCLDCTHDHLSGVRIAVKCNRGKRLAFALTDDEGIFQADLPLSPSSSSPDCSAMLLGGPKKLCSFKKNLVSKIVKAKDHDSYTTSTPLTIFSSCPPNLSSHNTSKAEDQRAASTTEHGKTGSAKEEFESSKTIDLPLPPEWGLPPTSYYTPFIPIIGIP